jgi:hypothetical protein
VFADQVGRDIELDGEIEAVVIVDDADAVGRLPFGVGG